jgi:eukaryotic-like serine/threonine-protein kinase
MATGRRPFQGKSQVSVMAAILHVDPPPISTLIPLIPPALERVVGRCLSKDPDERWQSARDLAFELQSISESGAPAAKGRERTFWIMLALLLAAAGAALALGIAWRQGASAELREIRASIAPPAGTTFHSTGLNSGPATISPDGKSLVFLALKENGAEQLWVRRLDADAAQPLAGTESGAYPFWSPDSQSIGFFAAGYLKRIDASGGPALTLCEAANPRGGTWSSEGVILFAGEQAAGLLRVPATGGTPQAVTKLDETRREMTHRWPQFLPGGRKFLYFSRIAVGDEANAVMVGSLDGDEPKIVLRSPTHAVYASGQLLFLRETTLMAQPFDLQGLTLTGEAHPIAEQVTSDWAFSRGVFSASDNGLLIHQTGESYAGSQLTWFDRSGKERGVLGDKAVYQGFSLSPDLEKVAVSVSDPHVGAPDLWTYEVARGLRTRFTFDPGPDNLPIWSPDGSKVIFSSNRKGNFDLYAKSYAGSAAEQPLFEAEQDQFAGNFSTDGRLLVYMNRAVPVTRDDIWVLPLSGERKPIPFLQTPFRERDPQFSPDGRWISYTSDESGRDEVYVAPFPGPGRKWQISSEGGIHPRWRMDGREIYYVTADNRLTAVEVHPEGTSFAVGAATPLFPIRLRLGTIFNVTPDGQRFLVNNPIVVGQASPMTLVVNWTARSKP